MSQHSKTEELFCLIESVPKEKRESFLESVYSTATELLNDSRAAMEYSPADRTVEDRLYELIDRVPTDCREYLCGSLAEYGEELVADAESYAKKVGSKTLFVECLRDARRKRAPRVSRLAPDLATLLLGASLGQLGNMLVSGSFPPFVVALTVISGIIGAYFRGGKP